VRTQARRLNACHVRVVLRLLLPVPFPQLRRPFQGCGHPGRGHQDHIRLRLHCYGSAAVLLYSIDRTDLHSGRAYQIPVTFSPCFP